MAEHPLTWTAPAPWWQAGRSQSTRQPGLLRFASDGFMEDLLRILETDPQGVRNLKAVPETWRGPAPTALDRLLQPKPPQTRKQGLLQRLALKRARGNQAEGFEAPQGLPNMPLKLYQPVHQRYYLVSACLVCQTLGFPDRTLAAEERVGFVIRRCLPQSLPPTGSPLPAVDRANWDEYAYVKADQGAGWRKLGPGSGDAAALLAVGEDLLPLFPLTYTEDDGRRRRLLSGMIPVAKRDTYLAAAAVTDAVSGNPSAAPRTARLGLFLATVAEPWKNVVERAEQLRVSSIPAPGETMPVAARNAAWTLAREQLQQASWYVLLDFAQYLREYLKPVWEAVVDTAQVAALNPAEKAFYDALSAIGLPEGVRSGLLEAGHNSRQESKPSVYTAANVDAVLRDALRQMALWRDDLEKIVQPYDRFAPPAAVPGGVAPAWPNRLFPLADVQSYGQGAAALLGPALDSNVPPLSASDGVATAVIPVPGTESGARADLRRGVDKLIALVARALPMQSSAPEPSLPAAAPAVLDTREPWFVIRCVYERPACGSIHPPLLSEASEPFQMAGFFDPDAPARPIRIGLPIDTTPGGLRKFDKNTVFMISDVLCGQIKRARGITFGDLVLSVLPWPFHKDLSVPETGPCQGGDGASLGMMCSLSIPIITLCALILLIIMVSLLDIIFHWIPYFVFCFPLPGFGGKK